MFKKIAAVVLAVLMMVSITAAFTGCSGGASADFKVGVILIGDETEGYSKAHMDGIKEAAKNLGIADNQIIWKYKVEENSTCLDAATDLVGQGCDLIISNSYGHQTYIVQAAEQFPDVTFASMTGDFAALTGLPNFKNGFTKVFQSRYVSGVVAGMKVAELLANGTISESATPE
ncbi:MAG: BMP family ABC transporter substrate-binding protein, partial [Clostridia bacterium]|nr:BMP family ABC transporter substrate-binding protein [Clostridia bacterium]